MTEEISKCPICEHTGFSLFLECRDHFLTKEVFSIRQCDRCGFRFVSPRPDASAIGRYYQSEEYISHNVERPGLLTRIYKLARVYSIRHKYGIVRKYVKTGKILDIGCGTGEFLQYCRSQGFDVAGVEPNENAGAFARETNRIPVAESVFSLPAEGSRYQCITLWHVLEHLHELNGSLEMIRKLLAPGGILVVAVPNSRSWDAGKYGQFWAAYDVPRHLYHFTAETIRTLAEKHGFEIREVLPQKLDSYYVSLLSEKYLAGKTSYIKAVAYGFWSNFRARAGNRGHSSQIFVMSAKKA
jgi:2-polyprenyl-3-methyl-5-hydroxy-6-metoxy-1,4-benzoquinol methylase